MEDEERKGEKMEEDGWGMESTDCEVDSAGASAPNPCTSNVPIHLPHAPDGEAGKRRSLLVGETEDEHDR